MVAPKPKAVAQRDELLAQQSELILKRLTKAGITPPEAIMLLSGIIVSIAGSAVRSQREHDAASSGSVPS